MLFKERAFGEYDILSPSWRTVHSKGLEHCSFANLNPALLRCISGARTVAQQVQALATKPELAPRTNLHIK